MLQAAIKFEMWQFLQDNFKRSHEIRKWKEAQKIAKAKAAEEERERQEQPRQIKLYDASRVFPMFNEKAVISELLKDVFDYR